MKEINKHMDPEVLITKYLVGEATSQEISWLEDWVSEDPKNKEVFLKSRQAFNLYSNTSKTEFDTGSAWDKVSVHIDQNKDAGKTRIRPLHKDLLRIAAVFLALITAAIWIYFANDRDGTEFYEAEELVNIQELSDGSIVSLNRNSTFSFANEMIRDGKLEGEAFFEVFRNESQPFVVRADELQIKVLGTSFYVNAKKNASTVEVSVKTGKVAVKYRLDSILLSAGQSALFDKELKTLQLYEPVDINYLSWKTRTLVFNDDYLGEVVDKLNEVYGASIELENQKLNNCKITVTFKEQELDAILTIISETLDLEILENGPNLTLKGQACD